MINTYNPTNGVGNDLLECRLGKLGIITIPVLSILYTCSRFFALNNKDDILLICHSQGALHLKNALLRMPQQWRDRINVMSISGASMIGEEMCKSAVNYVSEGDLVPFFAPERLIPTIFRPNNLHVLKRAPNSPRNDHDFQSPTFSKKIKYHVEEFLTHGSLK